MTFPAHRWLQQGPVTADACQEAAAPTHDEKSQHCCRQACAIQWLRGPADLQRMRAGRCPGSPCHSHAHLQRRRGRRGQLQDSQTLSMRERSSAARQGPSRAAQPSTALLDRRISTSGPIRNAHRVAACQQSTARHQRVLGHCSPMQWVMSQLF